MSRKKAVKRRPDVHCMMCGKSFYAGDASSCGGLENGKPLCRTDDIQRYLENKAKKPEESK